MPPRLVASGPWQTGWRPWSVDDGSANPREALAHYVGRLRENGSSSGWRDRLQPTPAASFARSGQRAFSHDSAFSPMHLSVGLRPPACCRRTRPAASRFALHPGRHLRRGAPAGCRRRRNESRRPRPLRDRTYVVAIVVPQQSNIASSANPAVASLRSPRRQDLCVAWLGEQPLLLCQAAPGICGGSWGSGR